MQKNENAYFWMKLRSDFFDRVSVCYLESLPRGRETVLFYIKLLCLGIEGEGEISLGSDGAVAEKALAARTHTPPSVVKKGLAALEDEGLILRGEDGALFIPEARDCLGDKQPMSNAQRQALFRERRRQSEDGSPVTADNGGVTAHNDSKRKSQSKRKNENESVRESEPPHAAPGEASAAPQAPVYKPEPAPAAKTKPAALPVQPKKKTAARFSPPTKEMVAAYCRERRNGVDPDRFIDHYAANGWMVGKTPMRDWQAAVRTWERGGSERPRGQTEGERERLSDLDAFFN